MSSSRGLRGAWVCLALISTAALVPLEAQAQLNSNQAQVQLTAEPFPESLTLSVSTGTVHFNLSQYAQSFGNQPVIINVSHSLDPSGGSRPITVYLYFATETALNNSSSSIPASSVAGAFGGTPNFETFTNPTPFSGPTGISIGTSGVGEGGFQTDVNLRIDTTGMTLTPGAIYAGTLFVQVQAL